MNALKKVFGIGVQKTGTSSLGVALKSLGYRVTGPNWVWHPGIADRAFALAHALVSEYDAFQDNPWPMLYKSLDQSFPGNQFILTIRPTDQWIESAVRHFGTTVSPTRTWIYGVGHPVGNEDLWVARYERHNAEVLDYFRNRPDDLLVMRITEGDGWEKLCPFLGREIPDVPFPRITEPQSRRRDGRS